MRDGFLVHLYKLSKENDRKIVCSARRAAGMASKRERRVDERGGRIGEIFNEKYNLDRAHLEPAYQTYKLADYHQACMHTSPAGHCGDSRSHTPEGTPIDVPRRAPRGSGRPIATSLRAAGR